MSHNAVVLVAILALVILVFARRFVVENFDDAPSARFDTTSNPWGVTFSKDGKYLFVGGKQLVAYQLTGNLGVKPVRTVNFTDGSGVNGISISPDGTLLVAGRSNDIKFFSVEDLLSGDGPDPLLATVPIPTDVKTTNNRAPVATEPTFSPDGTRVVCPIEYQRRAMVIDTNLALQDAGQRAIAGFIPSGNSTVGVSFYPEAKYKDLVAITSESDKSVKTTGKCSGSVRIANFRTFQIVKTIPVGCEAVRVVVGNEYIIVTSRADDKVIKVRRGNNDERFELSVGPNPVGIKVSDKYMIIAASNRFSNANGEINVINNETLEMKTLPGLGFPRGVAVNPNGTIAAVTYARSGAVELVNFTKLGI